MAGAFFANVVLAVSSPAFLPERVAVHFGYGGEADRFGSAGEYVLLMLVTLAILLAVFQVPALLVAITPPRFISLPNRDYWLSEERMEETLARLKSMGGEIGAACLVFIFYVQLLCIAANLSVPPRLDERMMFAGLAVFAAVTACLVVKLVRSFRLPGH